MQDDAQRVPVVEAGALELAVGDREAQRLDEVQRAAGRGAESRDVAGVGWDLGFDQHDVQRNVAHRVGLDDPLVRLHQPFARRSSSLLRSCGTSA